MPAGPIKDEDSMTSLVHAGADFVEMLLHGKAVAEGHNDTSGLSFTRTNRTEDIGPFRALVFWSRWSRAPLGPPSSDLVLLPDAGFILKPQLDLCAFR